MSSPVCHRANGRVYSHIPRKKHPPPSSQSPEMVALTPPGPSAKNILYPPIFPTCFPMETGEATHKRTHLQHVGQNQLPQILPAPQKQRTDNNWALSILRDRQDARQSSLLIRELTHNPAFAAAGALSQSLKLFSYQRIQP